jgi:ubiquitin-conjugating enzyme E2 Q
MGTSKYDAIDVDADDDASSVTTLEEDLSIFEDDDSRAGLFDRPPTPNSTRDGKGKLKSKIKGSKSYVPGTLDYSTLPMLQQPAWASTAATKCLMRDFRNLVGVQNERPLHELGWHIDEDRIENMYQWIVELHSFDPALPLAKDMEKRNIKSVVLELRFGKDYPMSPPFVRVVRPRFLSFAQGGGGNVTAGGAMCMELLTNDGWSAVSSIESVLLQVRVAITSLDKPARLDTGGRKDYGVGEAVEAYMRACNMHGWTVPAGFKEMAYGGAEGSDWGLK